MSKTLFSWQRTVLACSVLGLALMGPASLAQFGGPGGGGGLPLPRDRPHSVILILADDIGRDVLQTYDLGGVCSTSGGFCGDAGDCGSGETCETDYAVTPNIESLANQGIVFHSTWSNPVCSPTRATILTGRYGFRTGMGAITRQTSVNSVAVNELSIPEVLDVIPWQLVYDVKHAAIGKWHMTNFLFGNDDHPNNLGFSHFSGTMFNIDSFYSWPKTVNGATLPELETTYATVDNVDDAIDWIDDQLGDPPGALDFQPFFLYLPFSAAHQPWEYPARPEASTEWPLLSQGTRDKLDGLGLSAGDRCTGDEGKRACYLAAIEALDSEIGRLMGYLETAGIDDNTTVVFVGDNGTPKPVTVDPFDSAHAKGSLYEGGINVPLIVWGDAVLNGGRESTALVNTTDLFATSIELATGFALDDLLPGGHVHDSVSLVPILNDLGFTLRDYAYAEGFAAGGPGIDHKRAIRDDRYKLIRFADGAEELYDLQSDPFEVAPLPIALCDLSSNCANPSDPCSLGCAELAALNDLAGELAALEASSTACPVELTCDAACDDCVREDYDPRFPPDETDVLAVSSCQRPNPDGTTFDTFDCGNGNVRIDTWRCWRLAPGAVCPKADGALSCQ